MKELTICFFGSSTNDLKESKIVDEIISISNQENIEQIEIIHGGYQGTMDHLSQLFKEHASNNSSIIIKGILYEGYYYDPNQSASNQPSKRNDIAITAQSIGQRTDFMLDNVDVFIGLPGGTGTLTEILSTLESIKYGRGYDVPNDLKKLLIHKYWMPLLKGLEQGKLLDLPEGLVFFGAEDISRKFRSAINTSFSNRLVKNDLKTEKKYVSEKTPEAFRDLCHDLNMAIQKVYFDANYITGIDCALAEKYESKSKIQIFSVATNDYQETLADYLDEYQSILLTSDSNEEQISVQDILSDQQPSGTIDELKYDYTENPISEKPTKESNFDIWVKHLKEHHLSGTAFWINLPTKIGNRLFNASIFALFSVRLPNNLKEQITLNLKGFLISQLSSIYLNELNDQLIEESVQRMLSKILARNFSHHIGSHVATRSTLTAYEKRVGNLYGSDIFYTVNGVGAQLLNKKPYQYFEIFNKILTLYIVQREEYIANPLRGFQAFSLYREVIVPFIENRFVMDNITASEGVRYGSKRDNQLKIYVKIDGLDIAFRYRKGKAIIAEYPSDFPYLPGLSETLDFFNNKEIFGAADIKVALPHPHAFYSILENIIRNAAKHNRKRILSTNSDLEIYIDIETKKSKEVVDVVISDNVSYLDQNDYWSFKAKEKEELITSANEPQVNNLGLMDIKINANLMMADQNFAFREKPPISIEYIDGKLAFRFQIFKKKEVAVIGFQQDECLKSETIDVFKTIEDFYRQHESLTLGYDFVIVNSRIGKITRFDFVGRVLHVDSLEELNDENPHPEDFYLTCWKYWVSQLVPIPIEFMIYLQQGRDEFPTNEWMALSNRINACKQAITLRPFFVDEAGFSDSLVPKSKERTFSILVDRHGVLMEIAASERIDVFRDGSYCLIDKKSTDFDTLLYSSLERDPIILFKYIEAGTSNILLLDERVVELGCEELIGREYANMLEFGWEGNALPEDKSTFFMALWAAGIFVGTHMKYNSDSLPIWKSLNPSSEYLLEVDFEGEQLAFSSNVLSNNCSELESLDFVQELDIESFDFIVMHRTIAKALEDKNPGIILTLMNHSQIIITSGSSDKHGINHNVPFISINDILSCLNSQRIDKVKLIEKLMHSEMI